MRNLQRGQSMVEFAITLPLFFILFFFIFYAGMIMADYLSLSSMARSSAREAAIVTKKEQYNDNYREIRIKYSDAELPAAIFTWKPLDEDYFKIEYKKPNVVVTMNATLDGNGLSLAKLAGFVDEDGLKMNVTYTVYSEYNPEVGGK